MPQPNSREEYLKQIQQKLEKDLPNLEITLKYKTPCKGRDERIIILVSSETHTTPVECSFKTLIKLGLEGIPLERRFQPTPFTWRSLIQTIRTLHSLQE